MLYASKGNVISTSKESDVNTITYIHAGNVASELAVVIKHGAGDLREDDAESVNKARVGRETLIINVVDEKWQNDRIYK